MSHYFLLCYVTCTHCLVQLADSWPANHFPASSVWLVNEIINFLFFLFPLFSIILNSLVYFTDMKGVRLVEYCLIKLNDRLNGCRISEEINPFSTHIKENLSSFLLSSLTWLLSIDEESFQLWGRTMHLKKTRFSFQNNFPISEHEPRPHVLDRV